MRDWWRYIGTGYSKIKYVPDKFEKLSQLHDQVYPDPFLIDHSFIEWYIRPTYTIFINRGVTINNVRMLQPVRELL